MPITPKPIIECSGCPLFSINKMGFLYPEGTGSLGVLLTGEAAGYEEYLDSAPFRPHAQSGSILERCIKRSGFVRSQFILNNLCMCRPPSNELAGASYEYEAIEHCKVHFDRVIEKYKPKAILAMGAIPFRTLTGMSGREKQTLSLCRGFVFNSPRYNTPIIPTFHPAFIARGMKQYMGVLMRDLNLAVEVAQKGLPQEEEVDYNEHPSEAEARLVLAALRFHPDKPIAYDIETPSTKGEANESQFSYDNSRPEMIQFSWKERQGIALPWSGEFIEIAREILALPNPKWGWNNWSFDNPILQTNHCTINGENHDLMWCLSANVGIPCTDGKTRTIKEIVNNKLSVEVWSMNEKEQPIKTKVVGWHKNRKRGQRWLKVKPTNTRFSFTCTPDHNVWTEQGWKRADALTTNDRIKTRLQGSDDVIQGLLLGDGWLGEGNALLCSHSPKQEAYNLALAKFFDAKVCNIDKGKYGIYTRWSTSISRDWKSSPIGQERNFFFAPLSIRGLAVWYMDDGRWSSGSKKKNPSGIGRCQLFFHRFINAPEAIDWFRSNFGDDIYTRQRYETPGAEIHLKGQTARRFMEAIAPYVHPSMEHKLSVEFRGRYNNWMDSVEWQWARIESITEAHPENPVTRYCITVDHPTHRFMTVGGLVSNCWHQLQPDFRGDKQLGLLGLQPAASFYEPFHGPWKHLASVNLANYGCIDADITYRLGVKMFRDAEKRGVLRGYIEHKQKLDPIFKRMCERGFPVDRGLHQSLRKELSAKMVEIDYRIQSLAPPEIKSLHPKEGFKTISRQLKPFIERIEKGEKGVVVRGIYANDAHKGYLTKRQFGEEERYVIEEEFKHSSQQQLLRYIKFKGYKVPKKRGTEKETTEALELERLYQRTKDPLLGEVREQKQLGQMISFFIDGWKLGEDSRLHSHWSYKASGQTSSYRPNLQQIIKHGKLAKKLRACIVPRIGHKLVALDWKSFHAQTLARLSHDKKYARLSRLDLHSYVAAHILAHSLAGSKGKSIITPVLFPNVESETMEIMRRAEGELRERVSDLDKWLTLSDSNLMIHFTWIKKNFKPVRDYKAKRAGLGIGYGMQVGKLYDMNKESFASLKEAKEVTDILRHEFPDLFAWQNQIRREAHDNMMLKTQHGYLRWFYEVFKWDHKKGGWALGEQSEEAIAFKPANDAHGHAKDCLLRLEEEEMLERYGLINFVHDELVFECPDSLVDECVIEVKKEMEMKSTILIDPIMSPDGFWCEADASVGLDWSNMIEVK